MTSRRRAIMKAECPNCHATYQVAESKIPPNGAYATCAKCRTRFHITSPKAQNGESKQEDIVVCPKCGHVNTTPGVCTSCTSCGVVFSKYYEVQKKQKQKTQKIDEKVELFPEDEDRKTIYEEEKARFEAREKIKAEVRSNSQEGRHIVALVCACILVVGCLLPWIQLGASFKNRGIDNPDGAIVLVLAFISISVALFNIIKNQNRMRGIYLLTGLVGIIVGILDLVEVQDRAKEIAQAFGRLQTFFGDTSIHSWNFVGSGLYVILLSSIVLFTLGLASFFVKQIEILRTRWEEWLRK
jgi:predicted Zn finger-like uncharacterized protein